jgi:hypothetical protein
LLGPLAVLNPAEVDVPYTLDGFEPGVAKLGLEVKVPTQPDFEFLGYYDNPKASDSLHVFWRRFDGGDLRVRLTALDAAGNVLDVAETVTTVDAWSLLVSLTPPFGDVELGATGESKRIRIEGQGFAPLRIRSFKVSGDEFKLPLHGVGVPAVERTLLIPQASPTPTPTPAPTPGPTSIRRSGSRSPRRVRGRSRSRSRSARSASRA